MEAGFDSSTNLSQQTPGKAPTKLSCIRCKQGKLKCDRNDPCGRCVAVGAVCAIPDRKQRASTKTRDKGNISVLNKRIELLEKALQRQDEGTSSTSSPEVGSGGPSVTIGDVSPGHGYPRSSNHETVDVESTRTGEDALAQEVRYAKNFSINQLGHQAQLADNSPLSEAMMALDGAVTDLGGLANIISNDDSAALLTKDEAREAVQVALPMLSDQCFLSLVELDFMLSLTEIINSPHVHVDPAAKVVYYNLLFHGYMFGEHKTQAGARTLYLQCLVTVPAWQESAKGTLMDLAATSILIWTTALSFDYNLAWKFHSMGCRIAKQLGLHHLDVLASKGTKEDASIRNKREGFWQLVLTDLFFRLCYDKGSAISAEASPRFVRLPDIIDPVSTQPRAAIAVNDIIWTRAVFLVKDFYQHFDKAKSSPEGLTSSAFQEKVDVICDEIADMIVDWQLVTLMEAQKDKPLESWRYADTIVGTLTMLLQMDKLRQTDKDNAVSARSVRAARLALDTIVQLHEMTRESKNYAALYTYCIAFYPFRAFFALYYHILHNENPEVYKEDIQRLERIDAVMRGAAQTRFEYIPISKAISSLNQIAKHMHETRIVSPSHRWTGIWPSQAPIHRNDSLMAPSDVLQQPPGQDGIFDITRDYQPSEFPQWLPDFGEMQFSTAAEFEQAAAQPDFQPIEYMQAVENQFAGRNWPYSWWDVDDPGALG